MRRGAGLLALALAITAGPAAAGPELSVAAGGTTAITGSYDQGGASVAGAVLWPVEGLPLRFGIALHGDDLGTRLVPVSDVHDGTPRGTVAAGHRAVWGASWRLDALLPARGRLEEGVSASWGYYRVADDVRGDNVGSVSSTGWSAGVDVAWRVSPSSAVGLVTRYHRLFNDRTGRYVTGAVEWRWRGAAGR